MTKKLGQTSLRVSLWIIEKGSNFNEMDRWQKLKRQSKGT